MSVICLCICIRKQLFSLSSVIVERKYVNNRFNTENALSDVDVVTGTVKYRRINLCVNLYVLIPIPLLHLLF